MKLTVKPKMAATGEDSKAVGELPYGAYSQIARRVRPTVSAQHVREVYLGRRKSARIEKAIARYVEHLEESAA